MVAENTTIERERVAVEAKTKVPYLYQVVMHNDDYTPMDFVVNVLELFFHMDRAVATQLMYEVHTRGKAVCGIFSKDIAETKVDQIVDFARMNEHPLLCSVEEM
ncbi:MAG: ATP-dependent Clp protease adapter ClpS [Gammaproteobacteria bacterium]|nr:ATP-dependent Clp protease adapter ClpS [Gammaproteobacteria bacterium]